MKLSEYLVHKLFTSYVSTPIHRIELKGGLPDSETNEGGYCQSALETCFSLWIKEYLE